MSDDQENRAEPLTIFSFDGEHRATSVSEVERVVGDHARTANAFFLVGSHPHPSLSILVQDAMSYVHYFPVPDHPGYRSLCPDEQHLASDTAVFTMSALGDETHVDTDGVLPRAMALVAAREFFLKREPPASITWDSLLDEDVGRGTQRQHDNDAH